MLELNIGVHKEFVRDSRVPGGRKDGNLCSKLKMTSKHSLTHQEDSGDEIDDRWSQTLTFEVRQIKCIWNKSKREYNNLNSSEMAEATGSKLRKKVFCDVCSTFVSSGRYLMLQCQLSYSYLHVYVKLQMTNVLKNH